MRRLRFLFVAVLALCGFAAVLASSASGFLLENLPEKPGRTFTNESIGRTALVTLGGSQIECEKATSEGTEETSKPPLGLVHIHFLKCETIKPVKGLVCTGEGETTGSILILIEWHLWFDKTPTGELKTALVFLKISVLFNCGNGLVLAHVLGSLVCLHLNPTVKSTTHEFHCGQTGGDPEETHYWNQEGVEGTAKLETSVNGGAFESSAQLGLGKIITAEEIVADQ